ncbi:MAG: hypothetical protein MESAZ_03013 [Saezia sanguinis]
MTHSEAPPNDGYIYSGNIHESVPRTLFLDRRITPLERNAWQVIKMQIEPGGITSMSTYEGLRPYLTSMPGAQKASFETVGRAITLLRLTRWISLIKRRRADNGAVQGNLYMLHEEPLSVYEAIQLDAEYFSLLCRCITHRSKAVQRVAQMVLKEIEEDAQLADKKLPTRLEILLGRSVTQAQNQKLSTDRHSEVSQNHLLRNREKPTSESEAGVKPASEAALRNPKSVHSSNSSININTTTAKTPAFDLPPRFLLLKKEQQQGALTAMRTLKPDMQRQIVDEWCRHCERKAIGKPAAYLMGMIQKALQGEFNLLAEPAKPVPSVKPVPPASTGTPTDTKADCQADREKAQVYIDQIKALVNTWRVTPKRH